MHIQKHILNLLLRIGFTDSEARFYMAAYQNPQKTIPELQKISKVSLPSAYRAFDHLRELKLVTSSQNNWRKNIQVVSLKTIGEKLASESLKLRKFEYELKKTENLLKLANYQEALAPIDIFTDQNQITEECYKLINSNWNHISCYGSGEKAYEIPGFKPMSDFVSMRARKGRTINAVFTELGDHTRDLLKKNQHELRNGKLHIDPANQNVMTYLYERQITIFQKDEELGKRAIVIHYPGLIRMYMANFNKIWEQL